MQMLKQEVKGQQMLKQKVKGQQMLKQKVKDQKVKEVFFFFFFFFLHVLCLYATLWVMTDLSLFTYKKKKNLARLEAPYMYMSALSRRNYHPTFGDFSPPDSCVY